MRTTLSGLIIALPLAVVPAASAQTEQASPIDITHYKINAELLPDAFPFSEAPTPSSPLLQAFACAFKACTSIQCAPHASLCGRLLPGP